MTSDVTFHAQCPSAHAHMQKTPSTFGASAGGLFRRILRVAALCSLAVVVLMGSGLILADHLTPRATGTPSHALPISSDQTSIDRELEPLLSAHPGQTGVLVVADGIDAFAMRALSARSAGRSLDLQYYIWHDDVTGSLLAGEAHAAAERGVRVRILLDDMNAEGLDPHLLALDAHRNIELRLYNPFRNRDGAMRIVEMIQRAFSVTHRMHNKAWIVDGRVAVVGGRNIGDEYFAAASDVNFRDLDLLLFGPAVEQASSIFDAYWNSAAVVPVAALNRKAPDELEQLLRDAGSKSTTQDAVPYMARVARSAGVRSYFAQALSPSWTTGLRIISDPPIKTDENQEEWLVRPLVQLLERSQHKALLVSPYFVPGDEGVDLFSRLTERDVLVSIATNSLAANDVPAVHVGYSRYRDDLLRRGVKLYEVKPHGHHAAALMHGSSGASLHTKAMTIDDRYGFVGSFNLDPRSINLNTEMGVAFDDPDIARSVRNEFLRLTEPAASYWVYLSPGNETHWLERSPDSSRVWVTEPDTVWSDRAWLKAIALLPLESQL